MALSAHASAAGFGDLKGQPVLGQGLRLEINLLGADNLKLDSGCFRLVEPSTMADLPWLKKAGLSLRKGNPPVLEIRSDTPVRDPVLRVAVQLGCGHEISREYTLMAVPAADGLPLATVQSEGSLQKREQPLVRHTANTPFPASARGAQRQTAAKLGPAPVEPAKPPRVLPADAGPVPEPALQLSTGGLSRPANQGEAQRNILRLEYRMLSALNEQAVSQMATAEKLRNMEASLGELQQRALGFAQRVEKEGAVPLSPPPVPAHKQASDSSGDDSNWMLWGVLLGAALGVGAGLGWRRRATTAGERLPVEIKATAPWRAPLPPVAAPEPVAMPQDVPSQFAQAPMDIEVVEELSVPSAPEIQPAAPQDGVVAELAGVEEQPDVNPVMELADIMLSFGRVKGAAQALQEHIDRNPQVALQPWIRLMDVYRMAGMRAEFEKVARNLNTHFNVEVQSWDQGEVASSSPPAGLARPQSLEDMPRLMNMVVELWNSGDVVGYLYQLLRDNRGGQRLGFAMPVVEDILFLIELKETANRMGTT